VIVARLEVPAPDHMARRARPEGARKFSPGFTQGLPWVSGNKRFALKGLEAHAIRSRGLELIPGPYLVALSGLIRWGKLPRVNPGLSYFGHFGPRIGRPQGLRIALTVRGVKKLDK